MTTILRGDDNFDTASPSGAGNFTAKAWGNFSNVGGPSLRRSGNVSSLTDITTNTTDVNFTTAMSDTSYAIAAAEQNASGTTHGNAYSCHWRNVSTSKIRQQWYSTDSNQLGFCILS
tara:strand:- start:72 stop:422 length:351 start_codon:yes stop_codon:yes gene_type:complete